MAIKKNQHYVPQFYLRYFSMDKNSIEIFIIKHNKFVKNASISGQCARDYFYGKNLKMETGLGQLEGVFSATINEFCTENFNPSDKVFEFLMLFICIQHGRTAKMNDFMKESLRFGIQSMFDLYCEKNEVLKNLDEKPKVVVNDIVKMVVTQSIIHSPLLGDLGFHKITNESELDFITCDNPVVVVNPLFNNEPESIGLGLIGIQILVILSPKHAVFLYDKTFYSPLVTGSPFEARIRESTVISNINRMVAFNAYDIIVKSQGTSECYIKDLLPKGDSGGLKYHQIHEVKDIGGGKMKQIIGTVPRKMPIQYAKGYFIKRYKAVLPISSKRVRDPKLVSILKRFEELVKDGVYQVSEYNSFLSNNNL
jgi:hypothetical protein